MAELSLPAPAKLNRLLHITGRRADGYHELQTLFQFLDHGDTLKLRRREDQRITLTPALPGVDHETNLIVRAARLLQERSGCRLGADIALTKRLPMGGGLGGGSSNAATTLLGLARLWKLSVSLEALAELGLRLGADVPVFVHGHAAWAEGIGERLTPVELDTPWFVIVHPGVEIATPAVFGASQLTRDSLPISMTRALQEGPHAWRNDCQPTVRRLYPGVGEALDWLSDFAPSLLTGTGACVFCRLTHEDQADSILARVDEGWHAFKARGRNTSPLHQALGLPRSGR
ncbi:MULTISPECIES: 4-(cytidine 5'-diphospho)-2-C-methyl-D-erythritol kinase [Halomonadaceae]|uniref:4-diphosphocytidyl-2-C-methyl-D-erythritol kinase n=1 Tax=Modicisalibacter zincidurans TaxID=1178777 RepID=A0ABP9QYQ4_9GAMM|nr:MULTISPECIES: 4-(cytidine 5'-diphospho)-2-C-methyl-D-erythritol kinase [Halomonas]MCD6007666.1 4-(cytidine 5'-diphospho)-2-C-methyl-D-erythritol kinase [Halomonas sp. IOP_31]MEA3250077.1 4-(cytidine 5'-diphospho)-2-C-methyl-D-erythritol kinase [Pseudomonadota bacterium]